MRMLTHMPTHSHPYPARLEIYTVKDMFGNSYSQIIHLKYDLIELKWIESLLLKGHNNFRLSSAFWNVHEH